MKISSRFVLSVGVVLPGLAHAVPPDCPALGRPLSWDPKGAYSLDADRSLTEAGGQMVAHLLEAELGRAETLARVRLRDDGDDLVPAWVLSQILRVRKGALKEYQHSVSPNIDEPVSVPVLLYRFHVCRLAELELPFEKQRTNDPLYDQIQRDLIRLRDRLRPESKFHLGIAIALTQVTPYWAVTNREILEEYCQENPGMPDARPLLCQAYVTGLHIGPMRTFLTPEATAPEEPQPARALEIAHAILKERPNDPLGRYFAGISQFMLHRQDLALIEFKAALASEGLPPLFQRGAKAFIEKPSFPALRQSYPY